MKAGSLSFLSPMYFCMISAVSETIWRPTAKGVVADCISGRFLIGAFHDIKFYPLMGIRPFLLSALKKNLRINLAKASQCERGLDNALGMEMEKTLEKQQLCWNANYIWPSVLKPWRWRMRVEDLNGLQWNYCT